MRALLAIKEEIEPNEEKAVPQAPEVVGDDVQKQIANVFEEALGVSDIGSVRPISVFLPLPLSPLSSLPLLPVPFSLRPPIVQKHIANVFEALDVSDIGSVRPIFPLLASSFFSPSSLIPLLPTLYVLPFLLVRSNTKICFLEKYF